MVDTKARDRVSFPYYSLDKCIDVAKAARDIGGDTCQWAQLAASLRLAPDGGGFRQKMIAARMYGLLTYEKLQIHLTETGLQCVDNETAKEGRVRAFLSADLFCDMFRKLEGRELPPPGAIESQMVSMGVASKQSATARRTFMSSARHAGFFDINSGRMTRPSSVPETDVEATEETPPEQGPTIPAPMKALLDELPSRNEAWDCESWLTWFQAFLMNTKVSYRKSLKELQPLEIRLRPQTPARTEED